MSPANGILLGAIQGLTEFLPVSSSAHLAVAQHFLPGFSQPGVLFDAVLHLGTLVAVLIYFRSELALLASGLAPGPRGMEGRRLLVMLVLGTMPAAAAALAFGPTVEESFTRMAVVGGGLLVTGVLLWGSRAFSREGRHLDQIRPADALVVGLLQSAALLPGISRSGTTIVAGLARGLSGEASARFSFLLSVPAILGAAVYELPQAGAVAAGQIPAYAAGFATAFALGYLSIGAVLRLLVGRRFHLFGYYCLAGGGALLVYAALALP